MSELVVGFFGGWVCGRESKRASGWAGGWLGQSVSQ